MQCDRLRQVVHGTVPDAIGSICFPHSPISLSRAIVLWHDTTGVPCWQPVPVPALRQIAEHGNWDERVPVYVIPTRTPERVATLRRQLDQSCWVSPELPLPPSA